MHKNPYWKTVGAGSVDGGFSNRIDGRIGGELNEEF